MCLCVGVCQWIAVCCVCGSVCVYVCGWVLQTKYNDEQVTVYAKTEDRKETDYQ